MNLRKLCLVSSSAFVLLSTLALGQTNSFAPIRLSPDELSWTRAPNGNLRANVAGEDTKAGMYVYRVRFPPGFKNQPHFHPEDRVVTVLSGTIYVGFGEQFDETSMKAVSAGGLWTEPMQVPHYVWAKDGEVVIQIVGVGPTGVTPVAAK